MTGSVGVTERIEAFCTKIPCLDVGKNVEIFCRDFRHGLVHEARVKSGSEFDENIKVVAIRYDDRLVVNPRLLAAEVLKLLKSYTDELHRDPAAKAILLRKIRRKFDFELNN
jgi:hypothetical protein